MKKIILLVVFLTTFLFGYQSTVTKIIDGDTIKVSTEDRNLTIRFAYIDTPEKYHISQKAKFDVKNCSQELYLAGVEASRELAKIIPIGSTVEIIETGTESYNRKVAEIFIKTDKGLISVNGEMISRGYAYVWHRGREIVDTKKKNDLLNLEEDAVNNEKGLWKEYKRGMECLRKYHH